MKHLTYKISPKYFALASWNQKRYISVPKQHMNGLRNTSVSHTEPAWNPVGAPEYSSKQNFGASSKSNFDQVNCSDDQT